MNGTGRLLFLICFFLMLDVRFVNPTISFAEKFMDHAFLASVIRSPVVPPLDPWFGGGTLNVYYYLGYWMFGCLAIVSGVPSNIAFNLALPTVFALAAVNVYAIGTLLLDRFRWLPLLVFFLPNPSFFFQIAQGKAMSSVLWDSTRTITNTINEYPLFSFLWGDVHAHVISLFNQVFLIFLLLFAYRKWESLESRSRWIVCLLCVLSLGSMPLINTWDVLLYAPITLFFGALILWRNRTEIRKPASWLFLVTIPPLSILVTCRFTCSSVTNTGWNFPCPYAERTVAVPPRERAVHRHFYCGSLQGDAKTPLVPSCCTAVCPCGILRSSNRHNPSHLFHP